MGMATSAVRKATEHVRADWNPSDADEPSSSSWMHNPRIDRPTFGKVPRYSERALCLSTCKRILAVTNDGFDRRAAMAALQRADAYADFMQWAGRLIRHAWGRRPHRSRAG